MDITKSQFAKLVLGYLKIEKCHIAYNTFLSTSPYLKDYVNPTKRRHLVTRVLGLSLHDILEEFSKIYTIIQEHLEDTNYFNESNQRHLLHDQLIYLLEVDVHTRQSTPQSSTSLEFIPNASEDEQFSSSPPKKQIADADKGKYDLDKTAEDNATQLSIQAITDTLLKHPEFQEKIAENINKVRLSDGALDTPEKLQNDIDSAIKAVLEKTQNDPMFETLMGEIIGTAADEELIFNNEIQSPTTEEPPLPPLLPLSTQPQQPEADTSKETIDDHIKVAVDSIVTASQQVNSSQCADNRSRTATDVTKRLAVNSNNDIIFYDGTIDNYMQQQQQNNVNPSPTVPPLVLNNLLVVASSTPAHQVSSVNATKPFYLFSGSPYVNLAPTQPCFMSNKVLTEKDILSMPTVILNDDKSKSAEPKPKPTKKKSEDALTEYLSFNNDKVEPKAILHVEVLQEKEMMDDKTTKEQQHLPNTNEQKEAKLPISDTTKRTPEGKGGGGGSGRRSGVSTPRSTNKSHVRALDFKFQTPSKDVVEVRKTSPKVSTAKSLFSSSTKSRTSKKKERGVTKSGGGRSWDADLRATLPDMSHNLKKRKKHLPARSKPKANLNKTEEDAKQIENNLNLDENLKDVQQSAKMNGCSVELEQQQQQVMLRKHEEEAVATEAAVKKKKDDEQVNEREQLQTAKTEEEKQQPRGTRSRKQKCAGKANVTVQLIESENRVHEIALRNFNAKPRFHRKCNIENNTKFKHIPDKEMVSIGVADVVAPEATAVPQPLLIAASPSIVDLDSNSLPVLSIPDTSSFATPEGLKSLTAEARPISAGRNIMPILETPYKKGICPKTPGRTPMITVETPFTKVFNEQMEGVDISSIQTPQLTPFPITPFIHGDTPYSNRPTDYSTSSSYYQPSDTEQNKSLEMQIIEECKRLENKKTPLHQSEGDKPPQAPQTPAAPEVSTEHQESLTKQQNDAHKVIADKMKSLSSNVIGRKNLSMVPKNVHKTQADEDDDMDNEEEDEDDSDESSSCDSDSSSCSSSSSGETYVNRTIVEVQDETRYSLRSATQQNNEEIKNIISQVSVKNELVNAAKNNYVSTQQQVLRELDEKRRRTIAKFKNENTPSAETRNRKQPKTITDTLTTVQNFNTTPKRVLRSAVKSKAKKEEVVVDLEPMQLVETEMLCSNSSDYCDGEENVKDYTEAEKLVTGLRERGIHLMKVDSLKGGGGEVAVSNKSKQQAACSPDMNNSNEENKINTQNVQKSSNSKKEMYSFLFGPDDSKDGESEKSKTPVKTSKDDGIKQRRRLNRVEENRRKSNTKDGVKKNDSKTDKKAQAGKKGTAKDETIIKTTNQVKKDSKSAKNNRNSKSIKPSDSFSQQMGAVESSESKRIVSKLSKSEEKADNTAAKVLEHVDVVECLKKSEEDKVMDRTKMSEMKRIESTNRQSQQQINKTVEEEDVTISNGVVHNGDDAKEEINNAEKSKKKIINDDATSKIVDAATRSKDFIVQQNVINDPHVDEFDRSLVCNENFEFRYVESDPPNCPEVQLPLDKDEDMVIEVMLENGSFLPVTLQKETIHDFWHVDPKPPQNSQMLSKKRKRNLVEVLGDISVTPVKKVATKRMVAEEKKNVIKEEIKQTTIEEEPPKKKFSKHHKIEDVVADLERPQELLKEVDVDNFLDKLHGA